MALTRSDIHDILGPVDDQLAAQLAAVGGSPAELTRALAWYTGDDAFLDEGRKLPTGAVAEFVAILEQADFVTQEDG